MKGNMTEILASLMQIVTIILAMFIGFYFVERRYSLGLGNSGESVNRTRHRQLLEEKLELLLGQLSKRTIGSNTLGESALRAHPHLLVVVGDDRPLETDLAAFRKVRTQTQLHFTRLVHVTSSRFERYLERARMAQRPVHYLHLAVHANPAGIQFADQVVDGLWLSERLQDVEVLLLDGCEGDFVGDLLGVVPYVVTLMEPVHHHHAMLLAESFWSEIALGREPVQAYYNALERCPPVVSEFAQLHL
jgi:hypothetical protein